MKIKENIRALIIWIHSYKASSSFRFRFVVVGKRSLELLNNLHGADHKRHFLWTALFFFKKKYVRLLCSWSNIINSYPYRWFHRAHAAGPKVTSGLCLYIGLVAPDTNTVKVMSNEAGLRLCWGMCFTYIHLFVATHHNIKTFPKGFVE